MTTAKRGEKGLELEVQAVITERPDELQTVVAYAFSPIDLIPDFIPVLGFLDEVILLPIFIWLTLRLVPDAVVVESRIAAQSWMDAHRPKPRNYIAATIIIALWTAAAWLLWRWLAD